MHGNVLSRTITPLGRPKLSNYTEYQQVGTRTKKYTYRRKKTKHCYPHCIYLKHFSVSRSSHQMCNSVSLRVLSTQKTLWIFLETALCHVCQQQTIWTLRVDEDQNFLGLLTSRVMFFFLHQLFVQNFLIQHQNHFRNYVPDCTLLTK